MKDKTVKEVQFVCGGICGRGKRGMEEMKVTE
jgi:hypothetical protein